MKKTVEKEKSNYKQSRYRNIGVNSFSSQINPHAPEASQRKQWGEGKKNNCIYCKEMHDLDACEKFFKIPIKEKRQFVISKRLSWGCLKWGHLNSNCREKKVCKICNEPHPTSLHVDTRKSKPKEDAIKTNESTPKLEEEAEKGKSNVSEDTAVSNCVEVRKMNIYSRPISHSLIIPVWLHHETNPDHKIIVYALLDEQSDACFIKDSATEALRVDGPEVQLEISTVLAQEIIESRKITGLTVRGANETSEISLPGTYTRGLIPAKHGQIPRPESARKWSHLEKIAEFLMPLRSDVEVGLLIGTNCARAIKPREIIPAIDDDPYAKKTALGWGIIGTVELDESEEVDENQVAVNRIITCVVHVGRDRRACHLALRTQVKEILSPTVVNKMFELDFSDRKKEQQPLSYEDKLFVKKVGEGIHQHEDGHYEIPLPFKDDKIKLPNNKKQVLDRLAKLRQRFHKNEKYRKDYLTFMHGIIVSR